MIKVLHIIQSVNPATGGPIEGIIQTASGRNHTMISTHIVSLDRPDAAYVAECPVTTFGLGGRTILGSAWRRWVPWLRYGYQPKLVPWLRTNLHKYDVVVVNGLWNYSTLGARRTLVGSGVPYVVFTHGMLDPWFKKAYPLKSALKQLFWLFCEGPLLKYAKFVVFTTEEERLASRGAFWPYRVCERTVSYGTSDPQFDRDQALSAFRRTVPNLHKRYLLFLSRIHPKKGCHILIESFAGIADSYPDLDLVMAGPADEKLRRTLQALAADKGVAERIHWPGMLAGTTKWGAYLGAEAFVLPSHQENFGIVVAEAMACACPVLITDKVNIWREVHACGGGLVASDDVAGVTRLLSEFLTMSASDRFQMADRARLGFLAHFDVKAMRESIDSTLVEAVSAGEGIEFRA